MSHINEKKCVIKVVRKSTLKIYLNLEEQSKQLNK